MVSATSMRGSLRAQLTRFAVALISVGAEILKPLNDILQLGALITSSIHKSKIERFACFSSVKSIAFDMRPRGFADMEVVRPYILASHSPDYRLPYNKVQAISQIAAREVNAIFSSVTKRPFVSFGRIGWVTIDVVSWALFFAEYIAAGHQIEFLCCSFDGSRTTYVSGEEYEVWISVRSDAT